MTLLTDSIDHLKRSNPDATQFRFEIVRDSPWTLITVDGVPYAIWTSTGALHTLDKNGAVSDDPIYVPVRSAGAIARAEALRDGCPYWAEVTHWPPGPQVMP